MLYYNIKYNIKNDVYKIFITKFVKSKNLTEIIFIWLIIYKSF